MNNQNRIPELAEHIDFNIFNEKEFILCNLKHKHYLKINKNTYDILALVNGERNLVDICTLFNNQFQQKTTIEQLENLFYNRLSKYGFLKGYSNEIKPNKKPDYLKFSFIIFNENMLSKVVKKLRFLFFKKVAILVLIFCISILSTLAVLNLNAYQNFSQQESMIYFFITMAISVTFHEIGHVAAASYFGANHGGIGGGFYLFTPVYFADVTDIWRLNKWQRVWVNLSGIYFEFIFCSILGILGFSLNSHILIVISILISLNTLFNLNPFLRSDGYWIISDLTNKPNLLYHSIAKVKLALMIITGKKIRWDLTDLLLLMYGLTSYAFIVLFLYCVLFQNPNSILNFPENLLDFISNIFDSQKVITLVKYGELIGPLIFYYLLFKTLKYGIKTGIQKFRK